MEEEGGGLSGFVAMYAGDQVQSARLSPGWRVLPKVSFELCVCCSCRVGSHRARTHRIYQHCMTASTKQKGNDNF